MASDEFIASVAQEMEQILNSASDNGRLGLAPDVVRRWQRYFSRDYPEAMATKIRTAARDHGIPLDDYEPDCAKGAAEIILSCH